MRRRLPAVAGALLLAICCASASPAAAANYYGYTYLFGGDFHGSDLNIRSNCLSVPNEFTDFVDNDSWVVNGGAWIEGGMIDGTFASNPGSGSHTATTPHFFWADNRPSYGFYSHLGPGASMNTYYNDTLRYQGGNRWDVNVGPYSGSSYPLFGGAPLIEAGTETTTKSASSYSSQSSLSWYDQYGGYHHDWQDGSGHAGIFQDNPPWAYWVSQDSWLRSGTGC
jgi:hypothetical protein